MLCILVFCFSHGVPVVGLDNWIDGNKFVYFHMFFQASLMIVFNAL